jgi:hypothetical protein
MKLERKPTNEISVVQRPILYIEEFILFLIKLHFLNYSGCRLFIHSKAVRCESSHGLTSGEISAGINLPFIVFS